MAHTKTEVIGFCGAVIDFVQTNRDALVSRGMDIDRILADLNADADAAMRAGSEHELQKLTMLETTEKTNAVFGKAYNNASSTVDLVVGLFGKTSRLGHLTAHLRSRVSPARKQYSAAPAVEPSKKTA
ncbi:MAG: hypothetical protein HZC28_08765 [Spirochaetes bacterium]|nr:hypothetical protein [Spirochaetota bacterium]